MVALPFLMQREINGICSAVLCCIALVALLPLRALSDCPPSAEYMPGVDAKGWAVAPAEVDGEVSIAPQTFESVTIELGVPASDYSNNPVLQNDLPFAQIDLGELEINQNGPSKFNGDPIGKIETLDDCN